MKKSYIKDYLFDMPVDSKRNVQSFMANYTIDRMDRLCKKLGVSRSAFIKGAVCMLMDHLEKEK